MTARVTRAADAGSVTYLEELQHRKYAVLAGILESMLALHVPAGESPSVPDLGPGRIITLGPGEELHVPPRERPHPARVPWRDVLARDARTAAMRPRDQQPARPGGAAA